ncbi:transposase-like protein [Corynebacterium diphtheriae bv. intermedius str. NCTC 5011]|nr:transposase-like protein [Corynebacterium diphtheriae bv. intermedius str. NCTC 5011]
MYLATVIDVYSRKLVGHALADHMRVSLVIEALSHARKAQDLAAIAYMLNNRPRKVLGFRTPAEVFNEQLQSIQNNSVATTD